MRMRQEHADRFQHQSGAEEGPVHLYSAREHPMHARLRSLRSVQASAIPAAQPEGKPRRSVACSREVDGHSTVLLHACKNSEQLLHFRGGARS